MAAHGLQRLADLAETGRHGRWHRAAQLATDTTGRLDAEPGHVAPQLARATLGLGLIPKGTTKQERELARAYLAFNRLLQAWARLDVNRNTRSTLTSTADQINRIVREVGQPAAQHAGSHPAESRRSTGGYSAAGALY